MKLPAHQYLDERGIPYEARSFPPDIEKVADYAEGGIPEYWIVNPEDETTTVLSLQGEVCNRVFRRGDVATSFPGSRRLGS